MCTGHVAWLTGSNNWVATFARELQGRCYELQLESSQGTIYKVKVVQSRITFVTALPFSTPSNTGSFSYY